MTDTQLAYFRKVFKKAQVDDIGCGYSQIVQFKDEFDYLGIDSKHIDNPNTIQFNLDKPCPYLRFDCAYISWPINRRSISWHLFLPKFTHIVYIGTNTGGTCCGDPDFWKLVQKREVSHIIPDRKETLIHYGPKPRTDNKNPIEEINGIGSWQGQCIQPYTDTPFEN